MVSELRRRKYLFLLRIMCNVGPDATITKKDYVSALDYVLKLRGCEKGEKVLKEIRDKTEIVWAGLTKNKENLSAEEWIARWGVKDEISEWQRVHCRVNFMLQDLSQDGAVDEAEFVKFHVALGMKADEVTEAFRILSQGRKSVSWADFEKLYAEFVLSEDVGAAGNYIFGCAKFLN